MASLKSDSNPHANHREERSAAPESRVADILKIVEQISRLATNPVRSDEISCNTYIRGI